MFKKWLSSSDIKYGILKFKVSDSAGFPELGEKITVICGDKAYFAKIHKKQKSRIGQLTEFHKDIGSEIGDVLQCEMVDGRLYIGNVVKYTASSVWSEDEYQNWLDDPYHMNGEEIAKALGYSRQSVSQLLKRALYKCYRQIARTQRDMTPFEIIMLLAKMLNVGMNIENNGTEMKKFFRLFPGNIRRKIKKDAAKRFDIM